MYKSTFLLSLLLPILCWPLKADNLSNPIKVVVSGKVNNSDPNNRTVVLYVNRPGLLQDIVYTKIDDNEGFTASFKIYKTTDVWVYYRTNFLILTHPGDSIYLEFDGSQELTPNLLNTIRFNGDNAKMNQDAAAFQRIYFSPNLLESDSAKEIAIKNLDVNEYINYLDTIRNKNSTLLKKFIRDFSPNEETLKWASTLIDQNYYDALAYYPRKHQEYNHIDGGEWNVPISYYNAMKSRFPISDSMLISGYALTNYVNRFHYSFIWANAIQNLLRQYIDNPGKKSGSSNEMDSLILYTIIENTGDSLLMQMVLTEKFVQSLEDYNFNLFENHRTIIDQYINEPYLRNPLLSLYSSLKRSTNPKPSSDSIITSLYASSIKSIIDSILVINQGKVIYIDCWATWCGPCKMEMPNSKTLSEQYAGKDVSFVYLCIDSDKREWLSCLNDFKLNGQHFLLTKEQSNDLRSALQANGVPYYLLIDKKGTIIEKGSHLNIRPSKVSNHIDYLLKEY
jgi:thiol-disulfide isomerase/thioredoxin